MSKKKGDRREVQACNIYQDAGYRTERAVQAHYGERSDWFGLFDIMALQPGRDLRFVQVKSNEASGIRQWFETVATLDQPPGIRFDFLVCTDHQGWRLMRPSSEHNYQTVVDERDMDCNMGEGIIEWLAEVPR